MDNCTVYFPLVIKKSGIHKSICKIGYVYVGLIIGMRSENETVLDQVLRTLQIS